MKTFDFQWNESGLLPCESPKASRSPMKISEIHHVLSCSIISQENPHFFQVNSLCFFHVNPPHEGTPAARPPRWNCWRWWRARSSCSWCSWAQNLQRDIGHQRPAAEGLSQAPYWLMMIFHGDLTTINGDFMVIFDGDLTTGNYCEWWCFMGLGEI